ncbi:uncharacterized protein N0V89_011106 [Didymosphaeria variabile]|uniref:Uncharacterized protein n=1 Tax=Didymosphaeria variabile TaxID=1932322 RepID=A0A9W9C771_9PLEO|nr:uncharacterized protein N0V89_011106 [Didymosphaeria variabile]KAJ4347168.1 hypothetical protein N0V89_011106 [Didymosphaeria variabile]
MSSSACNDEYFLFPGVWNYAFAISAFNGDLESDKGAEVVAPSPASTVTVGSPGPTCAPEPAWCPGGGSVSVPPVGGGSTTVIGGTTTVAGGITTVIGGSTTIIGGVTTVKGGTTTVIGGSGPVTTVIGGTTKTTVIGGTTTKTVIGGTTTTIPGGGTSSSTPTPTGWPIVTNGRCTGRDCVDGKCTGKSCYSGTCADTASCTGYGGEEGGGPNAPPDEPDDSCTTSKEFPTCTTKFIEVTSVFPDQSSRTTSTSTISTCYTITACTGSATTVSTTTQTATTVQQYCEPTSCGAACSRKIRRAVVEGPKLENPYPVESEIYSSSNLTISERDIPGPGSGDWEAWYSNLKGRAETITVDNYDGASDSNTAIAQVIWGNSPQNIVIQQLNGCIALFCASGTGAFVAHFWERPSITDNFQADVLDIIQQYLGSRLNAFYLGPEPECYIMAGTSAVLDGNTEEAQRTLTRSDPAGYRYQTEVNQIFTLITQLLPGAYVGAFAYKRQGVKRLVEQTNMGYGKGAVLFDPQQRAGPQGPNTFPPGYATVAVYLQGYKAIQTYGPWQEFQIWRVHRTTGTANVAIQANRGAVLDPCEGDVDPPHLASSETVDPGSEITDVGPEVSPGSGPPGQPFELVDSAGTVVERGCVFRGGPYAPTADSGPEAGVLSCNGGTAMQCTRPYVNRATTCGGRAPDQCGTLGQNCNKFFQLLATCRY